MTDRTQEALVLEEVLNRLGMLRYVGPGPYVPGDASYTIGPASAGTMLRVCEEMWTRCGWTFDDTLKILGRLADVAKASP